MENAQSRGSAVVASSKSVESEPTASTSVIPARRAEPGMDPGPSTLNRMSCAGHMAALAGHLVESAAGPKTGLVLWHLHSSLGTLALPLSGMVPFLEVEGQQCAPPCPASLHWDLSMQETAKEKAFNYSCYSLALKALWPSLEKRHIVVLISATFCHLLFSFCDCRRFLCFIFSQSKSSFLSLKKLMWVSSAWRADSLCLATGLISLLCFHFK